MKTSPSQDFPKFKIIYFSNKINKFQIHKILFFFKKKNLISNFHKYLFLIKKYVKY